MCGCGKHEDEQTIKVGTLVLKDMQSERKTAERARYRRFYPKASRANEKSKRYSPRWIEIGMFVHQKGSSNMLAGYRSRSIINLVKQ